MTVYTNVFGGALIYPSELSYRNVTLTEDQPLNWPEETDTTEAILSRILDVSADAGPFAFLLPDAMKGSNGNTALFNNYGANSFVVQDADGVDVCTVAAGEAWQVYLRDNTTTAGEWRSFQYASFISQANAAALAGTGLTSTANQLIPDAPVSNFINNISVSTPDRARAYLFTGTTATFTLPDPATVGSGWFLYLKNLGTGAVTATAAGPTIDDAATKVFEIGDSATIVSDGTNYFTVGYGQSVEFAFDNVSIAVPGTGDYTLTGSELNRISYNFTGLLTGNRNIIVPATIQQYWVRNSTTGSFTLTVKTAAGTGTGVTQGGAAILYCNGIDVISADTGGIATPVAIADGGTGATTPSAARANLGSGATGDALFTSATPAAAYAVLGRPPAGVVDGGTF